MPIPVRCECGRELLAKDEAAGQHAQCPNCGRDLVIPGPDAPAGFHPGTSPEAMEWEAGPAKGEPTTSGAAVASLVLGLLSFCMTLLTGIPAIILGIIGLNRINKSQGRVTGQGFAITGIVTGGLGTLIFPCLIALLVPAVQAAREAARRAQCTNNLKQIALAMHNYNSAYNHFPPTAIADAQGRPLLSWRVAILPFIEQQALYNQFKFDEPWDSPHNRALIARMPPTYACPSEPVPAGAGTTTYQVPAGPGALFDDAANPEGVQLKDVLDGTSNTLMVVESSRPVPWTKPDDLPVGGPGQPLPPFGSRHPGGYDAAFADGSVRFLKSNVSPAVLRALITRDGGEVVAPGGP